MSQRDDPDNHKATEPASATEAHGALRDRTDEMELIISGLTMVALFTVPGWMFERYAEDYAHWSISFSIAGQVIMLFVTGLCYALGACFLLHLLVRSYWIGLIGLRTVFPGGINWERTPGVGPLTREHYRRHLPDLSSAIKRADRLASSLFAVISLIALSILWFSCLLLVSLIIAGNIGERFGATNRSLSIALLILVVLCAGIPTLLWALDAQLGARYPSLQKRPWFRRLVLMLTRTTGMIYPQRLILPVQLTLQSNTRPLVFIVVFALGVVAVLYIGQRSLAYRAFFTVSSEFRHLQSSDLEHGLRSRYYESLRSARDRTHMGPMIPDFEQSSGFVQLFLPYHPLRDNPILDRLCAADEEGGEALRGAACLQQLWTVQINEQDVDISTFLATERGDLRLRGLTGAVPLHGIKPGMQLLTVTWNPRGLADVIDDRYYREDAIIPIPFLFAPPFEQELDEETGSTPSASQPQGVLDQSPALAPADDSRSVEADLEQATSSQR